MSCISSIWTKTSFKVKKTYFEKNPAIDIAFKKNDLKVIIFTFQTRNAETKIKLIFLTEQPGDFFITMVFKKDAKFSPVCFV